jgi:site-specific DNA recombinase
MNRKHEMTLGLYPRVSTLEQAKDGYSINEQIDRMKMYCEAHGWKVHKIYTDAGYSGADTDRPGLQELIKDAEAKRFDAVLVYKLDRLSRSQKDTLTLIEDVFLPNGVDFISMTENLDTSTPFGRAMVGILSVFAQLEREQIKERMEVGKVGRAKDGHWCGSPCVPIGYDLVNGELEINEYEAMQIQELFRLFNLRISQRRVSKMLNFKGYATKNGSSWEGKHYLRPILENKHYIGMVSYKDEWYPGIHKAIIDKETFDKAQQILAERDEEVNSREPKINSVIAGLVHCGQCGNKYFHRIAKSGDKEWGYYTCYKRTANTGKWKELPRDQRCKNKNWKSADLEDKILGEIRKLALDPDAFEIKSYEDDNTAKIKILTDRVEKIDPQISKLMDLYSIGGIDFETVQNKMAPLIAEKEGLAVEIRHLENIREKMSKEDAVEIALSLCDIIDGGNTDEIKFLIRELIEKIVIDDETIHIHWKFA